MSRLRDSNQVTQAVIYVDGASKGNPGPAGAGVVIQTPQGDVLQELSIPIACATNNVAEYTGLIEALKAARALDLTRVRVLTDSQLMERQLRGTYRVKNPGLQRLYAQVSALMDRFESCVVEHVGREKNRDADRLASEAARRAARGQARPPRQETLDL